jgi:hypothetical protein
LEEFLELFAKTISMPIETLSTGLSSNNQLYLKFLTELYKIDFIGYQKSMSKDDLEHY